MQWLGLAFRRFVLLDLSNQWGVIAELKPHSAHQGEDSLILLLVSAALRALEHSVRTLEIFGDIRHLMSFPRELL